MIVDVEGILLWAPNVQLQYGVWYSNKYITILSHTPQYAHVEFMLVGLAV